MYKITIAVKTKEVFTFSILDILTKILVISIGKIAIFFRKSFIIYKFHMECMFTNAKSVKVIKTQTHPTALVL